MSDSFVGFLNILLDQLLRIALPIAAAALAGLAVKGFQYVAAKIGADKLAQLKAYAEIAVHAAEQSGLASEITITGQQKKAFAIGALSDYAAKIGLKGLDVEHLSNLIEAQVYESVGWTKTLDKAVVDGTGKG